MSAQHMPGDSYAANLNRTATRDTLVVNMGPQHPSTHGVLRVVLEMDGEYLLQAEPVLGYIHRMQEWMGQTRNCHKYLPNMGRVDYLHALAWNWGFVGAVERLAGIEVPRRAEFIRVITCELNRINSHLLWWGAYLLDLGAFTPIMFAFEDRERIMDLLMKVTGSRLTYCYYTFGGVAADLTPGFADEARQVVATLRSRLPMFRDFVTDNAILRARCEGVGGLTPETARRYGASGPVIRGSGVSYDTRRAEPYSVYPELDFHVPTEQGCDAMARYLVRMAELEQSIRLVEQALSMLPEGPHFDPLAPRMVSLPKGEASYAVESARGKVVVRVRGDGTQTPYRVKLRSPSFSNLSLFSELSRGTLLADAVSILGSLDLVIPEIDR